MRRPLWRRILHGLTWVCLAVGAVGAALWSYAAVRGQVALHIDTPTSHTAVGVHGHSFTYQSNWDVPSAAVAAKQPVPIRWTVHTAKAFQRVRSTGVFGNFRIQIGSTGHRIAWCPMFALVLPLLLVPAASLGWRRHRRGAASGCCSHCGYDLRATPARCPECGRERASDRTPFAGQSTLSTHNE